MVQSHPLDAPTQATGGREMSDDLIERLTLAQHRARRSP